MKKTEKAVIASVAKGLISIAEKLSQLVESEVKASKKPVAKAKPKAKVSKPKAKRRVRRSVKQTQSAVKLRRWKELRVYDASANLAYVFDKTGSLDRVYDKQTRENISGWEKGSLKIQEIEGLTCWSRANIKSFARSNRGRIQVTIKEKGQRDLEVFNFQYMKTVG